MTNISRLLVMEEAFFAGLSCHSSNNDEEQYLEEKNNYIEKLRGKKLDETE